MRTSQINLSISSELMDRIDKYIPKGERSKTISKILNDYCNKIESEQTFNKAKSIWFSKTIKPFIKKHVGNNDLFSYLLNGELQPAFKKAKITISDADIKLCIEQILVEGEE